MQGPIMRRDDPLCAVPPYVIVICIILWASHIDKCSSETPTGSVCEYFVAVVGPAGARYALQASLPDAKPTELVLGVPAHGEVPAGGTVYFATVALHAVTIQVRAQDGCTTQGCAPRVFVKLLPISSAADEAVLAQVARIQEVSDASALEATAGVLTTGVTDAVMQQKGCKLNKWTPSVVKSAPRKLSLCTSDAVCHGAFRKMFSKS